jgi:hypothetical protein
VVESNPCFFNLFLENNLSVPPLGLLLLKNPLKRSSSITGAIRMGAIKNLTKTKLGMYEPSIIYEELINQIENLSKNRN